MRRILIFLLAFAVLSAVFPAVAAAKDGDGDKSFPTVKYKNERFNFEIDYPDIFTYARESENGDGITLMNNERMVILLLWGAMNYSGIRAGEYYDMRKFEIGDCHVMSAALAGTFGYLEYERDGIYFFEVFKLNNKSGIYCRFSCPKRKKYEYKPSLKIIKECIKKTEI